MSERYTVDSDDALNPELADELSALRGKLLSHVGPPPPRFEMRPMAEHPGVEIRDTQTGRATRVPLFASRAVVGALWQLFGEEE